MWILIFLKFLQALLIAFILIDDHRLHGAVVTDDADKLSRIDVVDAGGMMFFHDFGKCGSIAEVAR